jgi:hypothetical protein
MRSNGLAGVATSIGDYSVFFADVQLHSARQTSRRGIGAGGRPDALAEATGIHNEAAAFKTKWGRRPGTQRQAQEWARCLLRTRRVNVPNGPGASPFRMFRALVD